MKLEEYLALETDAAKRDRAENIIKEIARSGFTFKQCANDGDAAYFDNYNEARNRRTRVVLRRSKPKVTILAFRGEEILIEAEFVTAPVAFIEAQAYAATLL